MFLVFILALLNLILIIFASSGCIFIEKYAQKMNEYSPAEYSDKWADIEYAVDKISLLLLISGILIVGVMVIVAIPFINNEVIPWIQTILS